MSCNYTHYDQDFKPILRQIEEHCREHNELMRQILAELRAQRPPAVITTINGVPVQTPGFDSFHGVP